MISVNMRRQLWFPWIACAALVLAQHAALGQTKRLAAENFDSGFPESHGTFNGMLAASDGKI